MKICLKNFLLAQITPIFILTCLAHSPRAQAACQDSCLTNSNTVQGDDALFSLTTGAGNTALGWRSLFSNTDGSFNTGIGGGALVLNTGSSNTAVGAAALLLNTSGTENTAVGLDAMVFNDTGMDNTAIGTFALFNNTEGILNTGDGFRTLYFNTTGSTNTASGVGALSSNTEGDDNTAVGVNALLFNITGNSNTAVGRSAGVDIHGSGNVCIGQGVSGEDNVDDSTYIRNVNTTEQSPDEGIAFVTVRLSDSRLGHQPIAMRAANSELQKTVDELKSRVARQEAIIIQQQKAMEILTAQLKEQAGQIQKVGAQIDASGRSSPMIVNKH
jgi:uncharacterized coiled-coil protein SlyX